MMYLQICTCISPHGMMYLQHRICSLPRNIMYLQHRTCILLRGKMYLQPCTCISPRGTMYLQHRTCSLANSNHCRNEYRQGSWTDDQTSPGDGKSFDNSGEKIFLLKFILLNVIFRFYFINPFSFCTYLNNDFRDFPNYWKCLIYLRIMSFKHKKNTQLTQN